MPPLEVARLGGLIAAVPMRNRARMMGGEQATIAEAISPQSFSAMMAALSQLLGGNATPRQFGIGLKIFSPPAKVLKGAPLATLKPPEK